MKNKITDLYNILRKTYGFQNWWPAKTDFEVIVGAILTQNTLWANVEKSIKNLENNKLLTAKAMYEVSSEKLEDIIRSSGYYKQKAKKLKNFLDYFKTYNFNIKNIRVKDMEIVREELLSIWGIGRETADSILCYSFNMKSFVVDTYTKRLFFRLGFTEENIYYEKLRKYIMDSVPSDIEYYKDFHGQIVIHSKTHCQKSPKCQNCVSEIKNICCFKNIL